MIAIWAADIVESSRTYIEIAIAATAVPTSANQATIA